MYYASFDSLEPSDLRLLREVLEQVCADKGLHVSHPDAQSIAQELINWRLFGIRHPEQLKAMLEPLG